MSGPIPLSARILQTSPPSSRKRRRMLRGSEDTSGDSTIEQYLYRSDSFRCTNIAAPLPLPNVRDSLPSNDGLRKVLQTFLPRIRAEINAIIKDQYTVDFIRVSKPEYPKVDVKTLILCVKIYKGREQPHGWPELRDTLKRLLHTSGFLSRHGFWGRTIIFYD